MQLMHYASIDRFRAILAWTVVATHVVWHTGLSQAYPKFGIFVRLGHVSVLVFIIISGFVITNLILSSNEPYTLYIKRRALRLFPAYLICLALGILTTYLTFDVLSTLWGPDSVQGIDLQLQQLSLSGSNLAWHILAHLFLLQGIIPDNVLYYSEMMFLDPAWSLSLEWQFYLIAPILIAALRTGRAVVSTAVILILVLGYYLGKKHAFGEFALPSFLPGMAIYFAVGILTRLYLDQNRRLQRFPFELLAAGLAAVLLSDFEFQPVAIWFGFIYLMHNGWLEQKFSTSHPIRERISGLLDKLGKCSYSTYLVHVPLIQLVIYISVRFLGYGLWGTLGMVLLLAVPLTAICSFILYEYVELPAIAFGKRRPFDRELVSSVSGSSDSKSTYTNSSQ